MPKVKIDTSLSIFYEDDCFADPWRKAEVVLLIHGVAESSRAWIGWVPWLSREFRVLRPDLRGFGRTTIPAPGFKWSLNVFVEDLKHFLDKLNIDAVHIIGAKIGGSIAIQFAAEYPKYTRTLTIVSGPVRVRGTGGSIDLLSTANRIKAVGLQAWAAETQRARLGSEAPQEQIAWWTAMMSESDPQVCIGFTSSLDQLAVFDQLHHIQAPTLLITTDRSPLQNVETVKEAHEQIPNSEMRVLSSDSYHIAAVQPDSCAQYSLDFIKRQSLKRK
jgi:3-oxoadipate enol-lactonase